MTFLSWRIFNVLSDTQVRTSCALGMWVCCFLTVMLKIPGDVPPGTEQKAESCKHAVVLVEAEIKTL